MQRSLLGSLTIMTSALLEKFESEFFICSSIWKVSKSWREIIVQDRIADKRRKLYTKQLNEAARVRWFSKVIFFFPSVKEDIRKGETSCKATGR